MRTTVTLNPEAESVIRRLMDERQLSFKEAINTAILQGPGVHSHETPPRTTRSARMGKPRVSVEKALQLAGALEDEAIAEKMKLGK